MGQVAHGFLVCDWEPCNEVDLHRDRPTLGRLCSRRVRLLEGHETITAGPHALVRHPAYLGTLAGHLGFVVVLGSWIPLLL